MEWIPLSERLPCIPEEVELTDGYTIKGSFIWDRVEGGTYFENCEDFTPIWWRPLKDSAIAHDFDRHTREPEIYLKK